MRYNAGRVAAAASRHQSRASPSRSPRPSPLALFALYSPKGTYDPLFISNYAYININDPMTRVPGVGQVQISGAGQYAMRFWVNPDTLGKLDVTVNDVINAIEGPEHRERGGPDRRRARRPTGQQFTYTVRAPGRLETAEDFEDIVVRAGPTARWCA